MFRTTIRVFEHEVLRVGDRRPTLEGGETVFGSGDFDALVRFAETIHPPIVGVGHRNVRFSSQVGYLQLERLAIEILPKADRHAADDTTAWRDALLDMISVAYGLRLFHPTDAHLDVRPASLLEVYIQHFLEQVEMLVRRGLTRGYRRVRENRPAFRGRLVVADNIRHNVVLAQRMFVEHEIYDHDIVVNQTLHAALAVLDRSNLRSALRNRLVRVRSSFPERVREVVDLRRLDRLAVTRNTEAYVDALQMARLILEHRAPTLRAGSRHVLALLFDMNVLWERYVATILRRAVAPPARVMAQDSMRLWKVPGRRVRTVKPDVVVYADDDTTAVVLDTKWKVPRDGQPSDDDLKQMFVYNEVYDCPRSLLVYPHARDSSPCDGVFERAGHHCGTRFVGLFDNGRYSRRAATEALVNMLPTRAS